MASLARQARTRRLKEVTLHGATIEPVSEFSHLVGQMPRFDFMMGSLQKALQVGEGNVIPRKQSMGGLGVSTKGEGGVLKTTLLQPSITGAATAQKPTPCLSLGLDEPLQSCPPRHRAGPPRCRRELLLLRPEMRNNSVDHIRCCISRMAICTLSLVCYAFCWWNLKA